MKLIIAEKPSVAKSIASALGASSRADGFYEGNGLLVSWCVGHLVSPMDAGGYDENFKKWRYDDLPILPEPFRYVLAPGKEDAFENLRALMNRSDVDTIVNACDAGREGELIFRLVYKATNPGKTSRPEKNPLDAKTTYHIGNRSFVVEPVFKEESPDTLGSVLLRLMKSESEKL